MRICKIFVTGCTLAAGILLTATAARTQTLISLTVHSDGATTEWAAVPAESSEGGGA